MSRTCLNAAIAAAAAIGMGAAETAAEPKTRGGLGAHDGVYAVNIVTEQGVCDRIYHWTITVSQGKVASPADGFMQASGLINPAGVVNLAFRRDNQLAQASGRVKGGRASGRWSSATMQCAGTWTAARQG